MPDILVTPAKGLFQQSGTAGSISGHTRAVKTTTASVSLVAADSGKLILLDGGTTHNVTLPSPVAGLHYKFVFTDATAIVNVVQAGSSDDFIGTIVDGAGTSSSAVSSNTKIVFDSTNGRVGDSVSLECDGTNWLATGICDVAGGVTFSN